MTEEENKNRETDTMSFQVIDKRQFLNLDSFDKDAVPEEKPRYPSYVEELMAKMAETERRFQERKKQIDDEIARTKNRLENDLERKLDLERQKIVLPFLEVMDNLQRALESAAQSGSVERLIEGVRMTANLFRTTLQTLGVEAIPALNQPFDPNLEQAVGTVNVTDSASDGLVLEEVQSGYRLKGQLLRPAQVRVGRYEEGKE
jgi:molecular chaperone GrpE